MSFDLYNGKVGVLVCDPKGDLYLRALYLLQKRLDSLTRDDPKAAKELRRRTRIIDFASSDPVFSYNLLSPPRNADLESFAYKRADLILDLLGATDKISLAGLSLLRHCLHLLCDAELPITYLTDVLFDEPLRNRLLARCQNRKLVGYFLRQFPSVPKSTIAALARRIDGLFSSEGVRLALAGKTAPDFRRDQDESAIVLINISGTNMAPSVKRLLLGICVFDFGQSVFDRKNRDRPFLAIFDEGQHCFATEKLREHMGNLLAASRSFGTHFLFLTQNLSVAVPDPRLRKSLHTNVRWTFSMRGEPADCSFLKPFLPVTGRKLRPQANPFEDKSFYSLAEEQSMALEAIANLPDRIGHLWFKSRSAEALKIRTQQIDLPDADELELVTRQLRRDPSIGKRMSRKEHDRLIAERDQKWKDQEPATLNTTLQKAYQESRGAE